jgi:hypothetical protein
VKSNQESIDVELNFINLLVSGTLVVDANQTNVGCYLQRGIIVLDFFKTGKLKVSFAAFYVCFVIDCFQLESY